MLCRSCAQHMQLIHLRCINCGESRPRWQTALGIAVVIAIGLGLTGIIVALVNGYTSTIGGNRQLRLIIIIFLLSILLWRRADARSASTKPQTTPFRPEINTNEFN